MLHLKVHGIEIPVVDCTKFLGIWIDTDLNWRKHTNTIILKIKRNTNLLTQGKNFLNVNCRRIIYFAHIQSHVNYCLSVWGNLINREQTSKIERLLCKSSKLISKYTNLKFLTLKQLIKLENYKFGYKLIHGLLPKKILKCANTDHRGKSLSKTHSYNTRNKLVPNLPKVLKEYILYGT